MDNNTEDKGKYNSVEVAKYIAAYWNSKGADINMTKLQKLLYIAYGTWLAIEDSRLCDEHPQAWPYGPVFSDTRDFLLNFDLNALEFEDVEDINLLNDEKIKKIIELIFNSGFGDWTATELSEWSHKEGSPWEYTASRYRWGAYIEDKRIKSFFNKTVVRYD